MKLNFINSRGHSPIVDKVWVFGDNFLLVTYYGKGKIIDGRWRVGWRCVAYDVSLVHTPGWDETGKLSNINLDVVWVLVMVPSINVDPGATCHT